MIYVNKKADLDVRHEPNESVLLTAEGNQARIELTDTLVRITQFKRNPFFSGLMASWDKSKIDKVIEIPRNTITKASVMINQLSLTHTKDGRSRSDNYIIDVSQRPILFCMVEEMFPTKHWYNDETLLNHIVSYDSVEKASKEANEAAKHGWFPTGTSATDGHMNLGRTAAGFALFGGLSLLAGGSRTEGKITVSYARTPEWLEEHNKSAKELDLPAQTDATASSNDQNNVILQLERLAKLKEQGILSDEEFQAQKKKILGTE
jgi:hypothetical protein